MNMIWFNHQDNFKDIMHEILKSDVTLVCDDNKEFKVHKIVLTACSPVLKSIFHDLPQINSVIYFTGVQHQEIESILEFMYLGSTTHHQERMNELLNVVKTLEIKEISYGVKFSEHIEKNEILENNLNFDADNINVEHERLETENGNGGMEKNTNIDIHMYGNEKNADMEEFLNCEECDSQFAGKGYLENHRKSKHKGIEYDCNYCDHKVKHLNSLKRHIKTKHKGIRYNCNQCDHQATELYNLAQHIKTKHISVKYPFNQ